MATPLGHERQITFFQHNGHDHDGENSSPVVILPGAISLYHLDSALVEFIRNGGSGDIESDSDDSVMPVPDLTFVTPPIGPGASYSGSVPWVGVAVVRMMRVTHSTPTECMITFYHTNSYEEEDREFRSRYCSDGFMWEGAWVHWDEQDTRMMHYKVENTGTESAQFRITLKSGTMAANAYSRFVEHLQVGGETITGQVVIEPGLGLTGRIEGNTIILDVESQVDFIPVQRWGLAPQKPASVTASATANTSLMLTGAKTNMSFGTNIQWVKFEYDDYINCGAINVSMPTGGAVYNDVKVEVSGDGSNWTTVYGAIDTWATEDGLWVHFPSGFMMKFMRVWMNGNSSDTTNRLASATVYANTNRG